ncbi:glycosyltransferase family 4 protein [Solirubrobacter soli]|uniref:glycosyltransferase family 4 protein n=1 Tax=Solirubrobacter soli TaxID=363832 RepID=UPI00069CEC68|nr:glycosyltransferase family 1 protein [Solirubrobacter soli]
MRVAYDETGLELDATGSARAARCLRDALEPLATVVGLAQPSGPGGRYGRGLIRELAWYPFGLPRRAQTVRADVLACPMPLAPPRRVQVPVVLTINDGIVWDHPEWLTRAHALHARLVLAPAARAATRVLVPSQHTRERVLANVRGLDPERLVVTPYGIDPRFSPGPGPDRAPYLLAVGTLQPRKNLEAALRAFERLDGGHRLVVVGARGWRDEELLARVHGSPAAARIDLLGRVDDDELLALYRGAACLLYPSRAEGFGFPPLEAMACGTPVVCTAAGSLPEVTGDAALVVEPDDDSGMAAAVERILADPAPWREAGLEQAARFSWARCAELTVAAYAAAAA